MAKPLAADADISVAEDQNTGAVSVWASNGDHPRGYAMIFSYDQLAKATNNFDQDSIIAQGIFGPVYQGKLQKCQIVVGKKRADLSIEGDMQLLHEIIMLSTLRHPNIVKLIGFSAERVHAINRAQRLLVYESMALGSLHKHLHGLQGDSEPLDWKTRMAIALGIAKGLDYLHNEVSPCVAFGDLCTSNILLDKSFHPSLSDFGLAEFAPTHVSTEEFYSTSVKSDVSAYGSVLLELITGRTTEAITQGLPPDHKLFDWLHPMKRDRKKLYDEVDPRMGEQYDRRSLCRAADVALICIDEDPLIRPDMRDVVRAMNSVASEAQRQKQIADS